MLSRHKSRFQHNSGGMSRREWNKSQKRTNVSTKQIREIIIRNGLNIRKHFMEESTSIKVQSAEKVHYSALEVLSDLLPE